MRFATRGTLAARRLCFRRCSEDLRRVDTGIDDVRIEVPALFGGDECGANETRSANHEDGSRGHFDAAGNFTMLRCCAVLHHHSDKVLLAAQSRRTACRPRRGDPPFERATEIRGYGENLLYIT
jgi:hypothetical protein